MEVCVLQSMSFHQTKWIRRTFFFLMAAKQHHYLAVVECALAGRMDLNAELFNNKILNYVN